MRCTASCSLNCLITCCTCSTDGKTTLSSVSTTSTPPLSSLARCDGGCTWCSRPERGVVAATAAAALEALEAVAAVAVEVVGEGALPLVVVVVVVAFAAQAAVDLANDAKANGFCGQGEAESTENERGDGVINSDDDADADADADDDDEAEGSDSRVEMGGCTSVLLLLSFRSPRADTGLLCGPSDDENDVIIDVDVAVPFRSEAAPAPVPAADLLAGPPTVFRNVAACVLRASNVSATLASLASRSPK